MSSTVLKLLASYEKAAFRSFKKKKCTLLSFVVLAQRYKTSLSTPPTLAQEIIWLIFFMHAHAFMPHIGFADKNREKMKRILHTNNFDVDIQMCFSSGVIQVLLWGQLQYRRPKST